MATGQPQPLPCAQLEKRFGTQHLERASLSWWDRRRGGSHKSDAQLSDAYTGIPSSTRRQRRMQKYPEVSNSEAAQNRVMFGNEIQAFLPMQRCRTKKKSFYLIGAKLTQLGRVSRGSFLSTAGQFRSVACVAFHACRSVRDVTKHVFLLTASQSSQVRDSFVVFS